MKKLYFFLLIVLSVIISMTVLIPFYFTVINSLKSLADASSPDLTLPAMWQFQNYKELFQSVNLFTAFKNSVLYTTLSVLLIVLVASTTSFILQRRENPFTNIIFNIGLIGIILPASMVTTYFLLAKLHMSKIVLGPVVVYAALAFSMSIFLYTGYYRSIPREIDESAIIDGCNIFQLFFRVIFPLVRPITLTVIIIQSINIWNDFNVAIYYLNNRKQITLVLTIFSLVSSSNTGIQWHLVFSYIVVSSLPIILAYFLLQKYIVGGITAGAVKG